MYKKAATFYKVARLQSPTFCWQKCCIFFVFLPLSGHPLFLRLASNAFPFFRSVGRMKRKKKTLIEITRILRIGGLKPQHHCRGTCKHKTWLLPNQHELNMVEYGRKSYDGRFQSLIHSFVYRIFAINQKYNNSILKFIIIH